MLLRISLLLLLNTCSLAAVEAIVPVLRVVDGDTIIVQAMLGETPVDMRVRLLWVNTPERGKEGFGEATAALAALVSEGQIRLSDPTSETWRTDRYGRLLAMVFVSDEEGGEISAQEMLIRDGHSAYWTKYGEAPEPWHRLFSLLDTREPEKE